MYSTFSLVFVLLSLVRIGSYCHWPLKWTLLVSMVLLEKSLGMIQMLSRQDYEPWHFIKKIDFIPPHWYWDFFDQVYITTCVYFVVTGSTITAEIQGVIDACVKLTGMPDLTLSFMVKLKGVSYLSILKGVSQPCCWDRGLVMRDPSTWESGYARWKGREMTIGTSAA